MWGCLCIISRRSNRYCIFAINYNFDEINFSLHVIRQHHQKQTGGSGVAPIAWSTHLLSQAQSPQICIWMPGLPEAHNDLAPSQLLFPSLTRSDTCSRKIHIPFSFYPVSWYLIHHFSNLHQPTNHVFWTDKTGKSLWTCTITKCWKEEVIPRIKGSIDYPRKMSLKRIMMNALPVSETLVTNRSPVILIIATWIQNTITG